MLGENKNQSGSALDEMGFDLVSDLERQSKDNIRKLRSDERIEVKIGVIVRPGNSSEIHRFKAKGVTGDMSEGGSRLILPLPLIPGDIYRIEFDDEKVGLPLVFGRCIRCRFVRENTFEASLSFFNKVSMTGL